MDDKEKDRIIKRFMELAPAPSCPMCHGQEFTILDRYPVNPVVDDYRKPSAIIGRSIPTVAIICNHCGFISQHAMGFMGLMDLSGEVNSIENQEEK